MRTCRFHPGGCPLLMRGTTIYAFGRLRRAVRTLVLHIYRELLRDIDVRPWGKGW